MATDTKATDYTKDEFGFRRDRFTELWSRIRVKDQLSRRKARKKAWIEFQKEIGASNG